jgi:hypothetical protein
VRCWNGHFALWSVLRHYEGPSEADQGDHAKERKFERSKHGGVEASPSKEDSGEGKMTAIEPNQEDAMY